MDEHSEPDQAKALPQQADHETETTHGNASWPAIGLLLGMGASTSIYLVGIRDDHQDTPTLVLLFAWWLFLIIFSTVFSRATKRGFSRRWLIYLSIWMACWTLGSFAVFPYAGVVGAIVIFLATMIAVIWEARV